MRYSFEFKVECVDLYHQGIWPDTPEGVSKERFHYVILEWVRLERLHGLDALRHKPSNREWSAEEKYELVAKVISGTPRKTVAMDAAISPGLLYQWVQNYKKQGYNGLVSKGKGRPSKEPVMKKNSDPRPLSESEREELIRLRAENEYIKAENEVIKKRIALRQEKWAAQLKAKKQQSLKNSVKKDTP
jgi:transposase-like protein